MGTSPVLSGLIDARKRLAGDIKEIEQRSRAKRALLAQMDAVIGYMSPEMKSVWLGSTMTTKRSGYFAHGELAARCLDALRDANEPITAAEIAITAMRDKGLDPSDVKVRSEFNTRFLWSLGRLTRAGKIRRIGKDFGCLWSLP